MASIHHDDVIFASQPSMSSLMSGLRRTTMTIHNRLKSIQADAEFVKAVAAAYSEAGTDESVIARRRPLVANERCGSWYINPKDKQGSAYFKSTDGHERAWKFSLRRLNMHIIELVEANDGVIIVDSTRRGKRMPDALSTTIPVWCTVINQVLLPSHPLSSQLFLPPHLVATVHAQVSALIPSFVSSLKELNVDLPIGKLTKPLRPFWVTQESTLPDSAPQIYDDYRPVILCTSSRRVVGSEMDEGGYIQGAGDDTENWAHGLEPPVFWANSEELLGAVEADLPDLIQKLMEESKSGDSQTLQLTEMTPAIFAGTLEQVPDAKDDDKDGDVCHIILTPATTDRETWIKSPVRMEVGVGKHKAASRSIRTALPDICQFAEKFIRAKENGKIAVYCDSGKELSIGICLAISCFLYDDEGKLRPENTETAFNKNLIKSRLARFMTTYPAANPSRATLQSVNSFLMDWRP